MPAQGSTKQHQAAAQPPAERFSYHAFPQPLQDASNLPLAHGQRPASAPPQEPAVGQMIWQHDQLSRSSSDCFSMDPAQLEADIAALTHAIAVDSAQEGLRHHHGYVEHGRGHVGHVTSKLGHEGGLYEEQYQRDVHVAAESRVPSWHSQPQQHQPIWFDRKAVDETGHGQRPADTRGAPNGVPAWSENLEQRQGHLHAEQGQGDHSDSG